VDVKEARPDSYTLASSSTLSELARSVGRCRARMGSEAELFLDTVMTFQQVDDCLGAYGQELIVVHKARLSRWKRLHASRVLDRT